MKFTHIIFSIVSFSILFGCNAAETPQKLDGMANLSYFDIKGFIDGEINKLSEMTAFDKTVFVNGEQETKSLDQIDFKNELKPFFDSDINKPAWSGKYSIDSIFTKNNELAALHYQSQDEKLKTKTISVDFKGKEVSKLQIENATNSSVANTYQILIFNPKTGFSIESKQNVSLIGENHYKVEVSFQ